MFKLLIAEGNDELRAALAETLGADYIVKTCADGEQAKNLLGTFLPDLLVLDLLLPVVDGITILKEAHASGLHPITLMTLSYHSDYIMNALHKYDVAYIMVKPCSVSALACQVQELAATITPASEQEDTISFGLTSHLLELGLSPKVDGFGYLLSAIPLFIVDPRQGLTKELYTAVGHTYSKSGLQVERCIRTAIQSAWARGDMRVWQRYFPAAPDGTVPRPSNGEFISHIAAHFSQQTISRGA